MHSSDILIWTIGDDLRCVMRLSAARWRVSLLQWQNVIKSDVFVDEAAAVSAADCWRQQIDPSLNVETR